MKTDAYFFLRRTGIACKDFDARLELATRPPTTSRVYMTTARKSLQIKTLKRKEKAKALVGDEDSEVEFVESPGSPFTVSFMYKVR